MALENARLYEDARKLADRDPLTGFYNHRFLHERLGEEVVRTQRARRPLSVLMLDLDDFKLVNDTFGHLFGDRVLTWTAELIRSTLRGSDIPARYGGDEFAIILPETDADDARAAAERILERVPRPARSRGSSAVRSRSGRRSASRPTRPTGATATDLIAAADRALYRVKRDGGHDAARRGGSTPPDAREWYECTNGRTGPEPPSCYPEVSEALSPPPAAPSEAPDRRIRRSWLVFAGSFLALGAIVFLRLGAAGSLAARLGRHRPAGRSPAPRASSTARPCSALETGRRAEAESFARILSGLSRSISPDAILSAIVDELARATDADHIVVVRRRPDARVLDATLISARPGVPDSSTLLPIADLEDPVFETRVVEREPVTRGRDGRAGPAGRGRRRRRPRPGRRADRPGWPSARRTRRPLG